MFRQTGMLVCVLAALPAAAFAAAENDIPIPGIDALGPPQREWVDAVLARFDRAWDSAVGMVGGGDKHSTRVTMLYATGLLLRGNPDDVERARKGIAKVLTFQYDAPGKRWHGTYKRHDKEPDPPDEGAKIWDDYDPNWREFIGTAQILLIETRPKLLGEALRIDLHQALRRACDGAHAREVRPTYSNVALMNAYLLAWGGEAFDDTAWASHGRSLAKRIENEFRRHNAFHEFNSPTYYGVDFYALGLWRTLPAYDDMARAGRYLDASLWESVARFYHAGLHNLCGPYDRSYGMDLRKYFAIGGICIALATGDRRTMPPLDRQGHHHDLIFLPVLAALGMKAPEESMAHLNAFQGPRRVKRVIEKDEPQRVAHAWIEPDFMAGVEEVEGVIPHGLQFHPFTIHWRRPDGAIGWMRLRNNPWVRVHLDGDTVRLDAPSRGGHDPGTPIVLEFSQNVSTRDLRGSYWEFDSVNLKVSTSLGDPELTRKSGHARATWGLKGRAAMVRHIEIRISRPFKAPATDDGGGVEDSNG